MRRRRASREDGIHNGDVSVVDVAHVANLDAGVGRFAYDIGVMTIDLDVAPEARGARVAVEHDLDDGRREGMRDLGKTDPAGKPDDGILAPAGRDVTFNSTGGGEGGVELRDRYPAQKPDVEA